MRFSKRKVFADTLLSLFAYGIPLALLQLVILPLVAADVQSDEYGLILSLIAVLSLLPSSIGVALNNTRLLAEGRDSLSYGESPFLLAFLIFVVADSLAISILSWLFIRSFTFSFWAMIVMAFFMLAQEYLTVSYRIDLNYKSIAINAVFLSLGYLAGYCLFTHFHEWSLIYLFGQFFSLTYILTTTKLWRVRPARTIYFKDVMKDSCILLLSSLLVRAVSYADRLLLYPILGGFYVSVYYVAALLGKLLSVVVTPINNVVLSYLAHLRNKPGRSFWLCMAISLLICLFCYVVTLFVSKPILSTLYPQYCEVAIPLVAITTATAYANVLASVANPFVLRFTEIKNQIRINGLYLLGYIIVSLSMLNFFGLLGFCLGALIAAAARLVIILLVYAFSPRESEKEMDDC